MATLFERLTTAGLPVESASDEEGIRITPGIALTFEQSNLLGEIVLEHQDPTDYAEYLADKATRQQIRDGYLATIVQLETIENATSPTTAQVVAAVKFLAKTMRLLIKFLARRF